LEKIKKKEIKVERFKGKISPLSKYTLTKIMAIPELILPSRPESEIIEIMEERINSKRAKLICTYCHNIFYDVIKYLPRKIKCPKCGSTMITYSKSNEDVVSFYETKAKDISPEEKKKKKEYDQIANLINAYGKNAVIVLTGKGIGPGVATRVLARRRATKKTLFKDMLEAQKTFLKTKRYWK